MSLACDESFFQAGWPFADLLTVFILCSLSSAAVPLRNALVAELGCAFVLVKLSGFLPEAKPSEKRVGIIARAAAGWKDFQSFDISTTKHHLVGLDGRSQSLNDIDHITPPFRFAVLFQSTNADVILESGILVRQVAQLHWLHQATHDKGRTKSRAKTEKQHFAAPITAQGLHGRVVHDFDRAF